MAFYKSKYTGIEIDQRLAQATYDDAVLAGFEGSKEEFDAILGKLKEIANKAENSTQMESENLETFNKNVIDAINELHRELQAKPDEQDVIDQGELEVFKDEIAAKYATRGELEENTIEVNSKISTLNNNLVESINTINENLNNSLVIINESTKQLSETLVAEINQRKEADKEIKSEIVSNVENINQNIVQAVNTEIQERKEADTDLSNRITAIEEANYQNADQVIETVNTKIDELTGAAPEALDTLKEIGDALNNDPDFAATMTNELSKKADKTDLDTKVDWTNYNNTKNIVLPSNGQIFGDFGGNESNSSLLGARIYNAGLENEEKQVEVGTSKVHLNLNSKDNVTIETSEGKKTIATVDQLQAPYEINLTNLLSAEDSESISTAIGGIDNLNATIQDNRIIVGTISNGSVSVSIRILGNVTTLYYLLDSILGLTLNEIAITNTSGTLSKSVTTHSVLTENMVINSLNSDETTLPLSASQGKVLNTDKQSKTDNTLDTEAKTIVGAINEILPKATGVGKVDPTSDGTGEIFNSYEGSFVNVASGEYSHAEGFNTRATGYYSHAEGSNTKAFEDAEHAEGAYNKSYDSTSASVRVIHSVGIGSSEDNRKNAHEIKFNGDHYIYGLGGYDGTNFEDAQTLQEVINSKQATITAGTGLEFEDNTLNVTLDTTVFKVVSVLPDSPAQGDENKIHLVPAESTGVNNAYTEYVWVNSAWEILGEYTSEVDLTPYLKTADAANTYLSKTDASNTYLSKTDAVGKIDPTSNGTGEIFNYYEGVYANKASGICSHAEGYKTTASGMYSHAEGQQTTASGSVSHAEGYDTTASGNYSHVEGSGTKALARASHAEGSDTRAFEDSEHAEGKFNKSYDSTNPLFRVIHSVGIGSSDSDRKNAHEIKFNGDHYVYGVGGFDGTNSDTAQTLQTVLANLTPNYTVVPELTADYTIPANATTREYVYEISVGETTYNITAASDVSWIGGVAPVVQANHKYIVSVINNIAVWGEV